MEPSDDSRRIHLDQTAFYPASGGQRFAVGRLVGIEVAGVVDEGERVAHLLAASADPGIDAASLLKSLLTSVGGWGGGSARLAQGIVRDALSCRRWLRV